MTEKNNNDNPASQEKLLAQAAQLISLNEAYALGQTLSRLDNINAKTHYHSTLLHDAVLHRFEKGVAMLLARAADPNIPNHRGETALHIAVAHPYKNAAILDRLIKGGATVTSADNQGATPLHYAAGADDTGLMLSLLFNGADVDAVDGQGRTTAHRVVECGKNTEALSILIKAHACLDFADMHGRTPLHLAVMNGHREMVKLLLESGQKTVSRDNYRHTPSDYAIARCHADVVQVLADKRKLDTNWRILADLYSDQLRYPPDPGIRSRILSCCLDACRHFAHLSPANMAQSKSLSNDHDTLLHILCQHAPYEDIQMYLNGARDVQRLINNRNDKGETPLMKLLRRPEHESTPAPIVTSLLDMGASVNVNDRGGVTLMQLLEQRADHDGFVARILDGIRAQDNRGGADSPAEDAAVLDNSVAVSGTRIP